MKQVFSLYFIVLSSIFLLGIEPIESLKNANGRFLSPEGILFVSFSENWNSNKLKLLYEELLKNEHGKEINALKEVRIENEKKEDGSDEVLGTYQDLNKTITLWDGKDRKTVKSVSLTLSHEYGHHFVHYWLNGVDKRNGKWEKLSKLNNYPVIWDKKKKNKEHKWDPQEILAEQYVYFYGSQNKNLKENVTVDTIKFNQLIYFENSIIPHPSSDKGLQAFWEKKSGVKATSDPSFVSPKMKSKELDGLSIDFTFSNALSKENKTLIYMYEYQWFNKSGKGKTTTECYQSNGNDDFNFYIPNYSLIDKYHYFFLQVQAIDPSTNITLRSPVYWYKVENEEITAIKAPFFSKKLIPYMNENFLNPIK